jgi:ribonucleoside-diphosphate reductase beta chain
VPLNRNAPHHRNCVRAKFARRITIADTTQLEAAYGRDTMPRGFLRLNAALCEQYMHFIANRRCAQLGLAPVFADADNSFPWMSEAMGLKKKRTSSKPEHQNNGALSRE